MKYLFLISLKCLIGLVFLVFVSSLVIYLFFPDPETTVPLSIIRMNAAINQIGGFLMLMRIFLYLVVWFYWHPIMKYLYAGKAPKAMAYMQSRRNFYLCVFLAIEIILVQNILSTLWP